MLLTFLLLGNTLVFSQGEEEVFTIVEQMPVFGVCNEGQINEKIVSYHKEAQYCSLKNIEAYLKKEVEAIRDQYPSDYLNALVQFIVEVDGSLSHAKIIHTSGIAALDKDIVKIIAGMQNWQAGKQRGIPVRVQYTLPVILTRN